MCFFIHYLHRCYLHSAYMKVTNIIFDYECFLPCFLQARLPHDDNDMYDRHVLPAGHPHWTWMEHVIHNCLWRAKDTVCVCVWENFKHSARCNVISNLIDWSAYRRYILHIPVLWKMQTRRDKNHRSFDQNVDPTVRLYQYDALVLGDGSTAILLSYLLFQKLEPFSL